MAKLNEKDHFYLKFVFPDLSALERKWQMAESDHVSHLRRLIELLRSSDEPVVLAVAAHDLGQYVKYHERGKKYVVESTSILVHIQLISPSLGS